MVSITALLSDQCEDQKVLEIENELNSHIKSLHESKNCLNMIQIDTSRIPENHLTTLDIVAKPEDFSMLDVYGMKRLTLDYLCWQDEVESD